MWPLTDAGVLPGEADENCTCPKGQGGAVLRGSCVSSATSSPPLFLLALRVHHRAGGFPVHCVLWGVVGLDAVM